MPEVRLGSVSLDNRQSHHLRDVLRVQPGEAVEVFDNEGRSAVAAVEAIQPGVVLGVTQIETAVPVCHLTVASAVPKGDRADWMVEKLSEVGVSTFIPLRTARSVVHPEGRSKIERWERIAVESAKQCRRPGVLQIQPLADVRTLLPTIPKGNGYFGSTNPTAPSLPSSFIVHRSSFLLIGPEGDWTPDEEAAFVASGLTAVSLGPTILRVETAAVVAAALAMVRAAEGD
jgi:16S rRNA (uracil1498-N3)-methyltransferase